MLFRSRARVLFMRFGVGNSEAIKWYRRAAEQDILPAMNNLGVIYATGQGVKRNETEAIKWYRKAAQKGDQTAIRNLQKRGISL